jgi:hypothetical protein
LTGATVIDPLQAEQVSLTMVPQGAEGPAMLVTTPEAEPVHPLPSVTVTVYVFAVMLLRTCVLPAGVHAYEINPAVAVAVPSAWPQCSSVVVTVGVGLGFTVTVDAAVPEQPAAVIAVTVYPVVIAGEHVGVAPDNPPVHIQLVATGVLFTVRDAVAPAQIEGLFTVTVGFGLTVTVEKAVPVHPSTVVAVTVYPVVVAGEHVGVAPDNPPVHNQPVAAGALVTVSVAV